MGFAVTKHRCSFYTGAGPLTAHTEELAGYQLWQGTINFPPDRPLPPTSWPCSFTTQAEPGPLMPHPAPSQRS
ncbi:MAG: hypothetical protein M3Y91_14365 [Actinomycetota bacterium]|nr:hypothetical protein [Actinomycetota bacterium]